MEILNTLEAPLRSVQPQLEATKNLIPAPVASTMAKMTTIPDNNTSITFQSQNCKSYLPRTIKNQIHQKMSPQHQSRIVEKKKPLLDSFTFNQRSPSLHQPLGEKKSCELTSTLFPECSAVSSVMSLTSSSWLSSNLDTLVVSRDYEF